MPHKAHREGFEVPSQSDGIAQSQLRDFGGHFAALCSALTGILLFLVIAALVLASGEAPDNTQAPVEAQGSQSAHFATRADIFSLWREHRHREAKQEVSLANTEISEERLRRLERALEEKVPAAGFDVVELAAEKATKAQEKAAAAAAAAASSASAARAAAAGASSERHGSAGESDPTIGLGVDWAAWRAGAEIDHSHSSPGLGRNTFSRFARLVATAFPQWRMLLDNAAGSHPPEIVLAWDASPPLRCFSLAPGGVLSVRFLKPLRASHVAIEQTPHWAAAKPLAAPRRFEVRAWPAMEETEPYSIKLGAFEYQLEGLRSQVFSLTDSSGNANGGRVQAVQFRFLDNWGEEGLTSICRVRVFGEEAKQ